MKYRIAAILSAWIPLACSGGSGPGSPGPAALAYAMPDVNPVTWTAADTVRIDMDIGGTPIDVTVRSEAMMEARFSRAGGGLAADIRYTSLAGSLANSMGPPVTISSSDMPEAASLQVGPRGAVTVVDLPEATEAFRQVFGAESAYRRLFVRLPGRAVESGTMWTDTVSTVEDVGGMNTRSTQIITSTLAGDTTVDGRRLLVIHSDITGSTQIAGMNQGIEFRQYFNGRSSAVTLWDAARSVLFERVETGTSSGSMELPAMGMTGLPVSMRSKFVLRLGTE